MASRSVSAAALLAVIATAAVFQATSAYVIPEVVLMRVKRNPEPMRSFSFSGFNPNGQMSAFTGLAEYPIRPTNSNNSTAVRRPRAVNSNRKSTDHRSRDRQPILRNRATTA